MAGNARRTRVFRRNFAPKQKKIFRYAMLKNFNYPIMILNVLMVFFLIFRITWGPKLTAATSRRKCVLQDLLNGEASCWKNEYCSKAVRARYCNYQAELCGKLTAVNISCFVDVWRCVNREFCVVLKKNFLWSSVEISSYHVETPGIQTSVIYWPAKVSWIISWALWTLIQLWYLKAFL